MKGSGQSRATGQQHNEARSQIGRHRYYGGLRLVGIGGRGTSMSKHSRHYRSARNGLVAISFTKPDKGTTKTRNRRRNKMARASRKANRG